MRKQSGRLLYLEQHHQIRRNTEIGRSLRRRAQGVMEPVPGWWCAGPPSSVTPRYGHVRQANGRIAYRLRSLKQMVGIPEYSLNRRRTANARVVSTYGMR